MCVSLISSVFDSRGHCYLALFPRLRTGWCKFSINDWSLSQRPKLLCLGDTWVGDGQGSLACCSPGDCKKSETNDRLNWTELRLAWCNNNNMNINIFNSAFFFICWSDIFLIYDDGKWKDSWSLTKMAPFLQQNLKSWNTQLCECVYICVMEKNHFRFFFRLNIQVEYDHSKVWDSMYAMCQIVTWRTRLQPCAILITSCSLHSHGVVWLGSRSGWSSNK